jgi:hypothetical protein
LLWKGGLGLPITRGLPFRLASPPTPYFIERGPRACALRIFRRVHRRIDSFLEIFLNPSTTPYPTQDEGVAQILYFYSLLNLPPKLSFLGFFFYKVLYSLLFWREGWRRIFSSTPLSKVSRKNGSRESRNFLIVFAKLEMRCLR